MELKPDFRDSVRLVGKQEVGRDYSPEVDFRPAMGIATARDADENIAPDYRRAARGTRWPME